MHFGQKNCTNCTIGRICPIEGLNMPLNCPPGFVCNKEGLVFPEVLCRVGHICLGGVMTGTDNKKRSCFIALDKKSCPYGQFYSKEINGVFSAQLFDNYFYGENVCCMNGTDVQNYIIAIGKSNQQKELFMSYGYIINKTGEFRGKVFYWMWDGMRIVDKAAYKLKFNDSDRFPIPIRKHREMIIRYFYNMYTAYMQELCPGKSLCLEGVNTKEDGVGLISQPFGCPTGSFCQKGSDSVIGSGLCPIGYYCPPNTQFPIPAPKGRYTGAPGAVEAQICQPGTYADQEKSTECKVCPNGFECKQKETVLPTICPVGMYRSVIQSNVCLACPRGTFNFERGARDQMECLECPPGRICDTEALNNMTQTIACTDGQVCSTGTGMKTAQACPQGYYCIPQTSDNSKFNNVCDRGFFCRSGTGFSTKNRDTCPQTYYCPPGTGQVAILGSTADYTTYARDPILTRCPYGAGDDGSDTKNRIEQCLINTKYKLLQGDAAIRPPDQEAIAAAAALAAQEKTSQTSTNPASSSRLLSVSRERRGLISQAELKAAQEMLTQLYEIEFAVGEYKDRVRDQDNPPTNIASPIQNQINLKREYIARWSPLNMSIISEFEQMEVLSEDALETNIPNVIFDLPASSYALVTFDLRHLRSEDFRWTYGEDYQISFTIHEELSIEDPSDPVPMPEQFLSNMTNRADVLEFNILALANVKLRIDVLLFDSLFLNYRLLFVNTTSVEIRSPNRANYGEYSIFILSLVYEHEITLPHNIPKLMLDDISLPSHLVSLAYSRSLTWDPLIHKSIKNRNIWVPSSLYWGNRPRINLNYLPYFSNCKGFGKYIPLWSLMQEHQACTHIPFNETVWMNEYSFGLKPTADYCEDALVECVYDENIGERQPQIRWFEVLTGTAIFQTTVDTFFIEEELQSEYDPTQTLDVAPAYDGDQTGMIPRLMNLTFSYYQVDNYQKRIILAELAYDGFLALTESEKNLSEQIYYNLTFNLVPLSHKDLTINFAFTSRFYIILYLLVGSLATAITIVFVMYHRIVGRPPLGAKKFASFKFLSYLKLTYSPAFQGVGLGLVPIILGNLFITVVISGHLMSLKTPLFYCDSTDVGDAGCIYTLFDLIVADTEDVSIDYVVLRTGRTGTAFLVMGSYVTLAALLVLIPDKTDSGKVPEAYDGNIWEYFIWKRSNIMYTAVFLMFFELAVIQFSFSAIYGDNAWVMMGVFKIIEIIVETMLDAAVVEALMLSPLQVSFAVVLGLTGFGAANFLDFLQGYFIDVGISMFERTYLDSVIEVVQGWLEDSVPKIRRAFVKWIDIKEDDEEVKKEDDEDEDGEGNEEEKKEEEKEEEKQGGEEEEEDDDEEMSEGSDIVYSDDSSIQSNLEDLSLDDDPNMLLYHARRMNDSDIPSIDVSMEMREKRQKEKELKAKRQRDLERHLKGQADESDGGAKAHEKEFNEYQKANAEAEEGQEEDEDVQLNDVEIQEVEPLIDFYGGFCNDTLSVIYQPFFTGLIWIYYDETVVASLYGIRIQDFIFYFLFNLIIIPFQAIIDIMFQNLQEWFHGLPSHDYADFMAFKFKKRKILWKGNEEQTNNQIETTLRSLDQMCFSSQYFFIITLAASGLNQIVLGIQILLGQPTYNIFGDLATLPLIGFMAAMSVITHRFLLWSGRFFGIWKVQTPLEKEEVKKEGMSIGELFSRVLEPLKNNVYGNKDTPDEVKFDTFKWLNADRVKVEEDNNMRELKTDRLVAETFRELFMKHNKPWVQEQIYEIFTPRTLFVYRDQILDQFKKVMGDMKPNLSTDEELSQEEVPDSSALDESSLLDDKDKNKMKVRKKEEYDWVKNNDTPITRAIIKFWIIRARFRQKVRLQVTQILDYMLKPNCLYCRTVFGLRVELIQNIEDLFYEFLRYKRAHVVSYKIVDWQRYFTKHANTRTICEDCSHEIDVYHANLMKKMRQLEKKRLGIVDEESAKDSDDSDGVLDETLTLRGRKEKVKKISNGAKAVIKLWISKARGSMKAKAAADL